VIRLLSRRSVVWRSIWMLCGAWLLYACGSIATRGGEGAFVSSRDGVEVFYTAQGRGTVTLVFVHGWSCDLTYWEPHLKSFAEDYRVLAVDLAGHGRSGSQREEWSIAAFGDDVASVVRAAASEQVVLVGHSMGGPVVVEAARQLGARVAGIVVVDALRDVNRVATPEGFAAFSAELREDFRRGTEAWVRRVMFVPKSDPALVDRIARDMAAAPPGIALQALESNYFWDARAALKTLDVPLRAINSRERKTDERALTAAGAEVVWRLPDVGHFLMTEDPSGFRSLLDEALRAFARKAGVASAAGPTTAGPTPPNIVLFLVDDLGWSDLGCYGSTFYETPHTDGLARDGMRFTAAYAAAPVCSPTRASLIAGQNPARLGFTGHITAILKYRYPKDGRIIPPQDHMRLRLEEVTIAEALKPAGYVSASIGKWHLGEEGLWPLEQGFDINIAGTTHGSPPGYFYPYERPKSKWNRSISTLHGGVEGEYLTDRLTDEAVRFIEDNKARPFFLYLTHYSVHTPLQAPRPLVEKYEQKLLRDTSGKNATYGAMVETVDQSLGRVLATLERHGLSDNTIVVFFSDNGGLSSATNNAPLRAGKQQLYEGGIRVPLIVRWPGQVPAGEVSDLPVISHDLYPTFAELAGSAARPGKTDGRSLVPLLTGGEELPERALYWYYPHYAKRPGAVVRDGDWKLIEFYDPPAVELYHLGVDLGEEQDLAERHPARVAAMRGQLAHWLADVGATLHTPNPAFRGEHAGEASGR
jgi:arylsulfatase A